MAADPTKITPAAPFTRPPSKRPDAPPLRRELASLFVTATNAPRILYTEVEGARRVSDTKSASSSAAAAAPFTFRRGTFGGDDD